MMPESKHLCLCLLWKRCSREASYDDYTKALYLSLMDDRVVRPQWKSRHLVVCFFTFIALLFIRRSYLFMQDKNRRFCMKIKRSGLMAFLLRECVMIIRVISNVGIALAIFKLMGGDGLDIAIDMDWKMLFAVSVSCAVIAVLLDIGMSKITK